MQIVIPRGDGQIDDDVAFAIEMTNMCEALHCLPGPGGLMNQDSLYVYMMAQVLMAQSEKESLGR